MDLSICFGLSFICKMRIILFCVQGCSEVHVTKLFVDKPQKKSLSGAWRVLLDISRVESQCCHVLLYDLGKATKPSIPHFLFHNMGMRIKVTPQDFCEK